MLRREIDWSFVGEWTFIFFFCILYAIIANVQSRLFPADGSMAVEVRKMVDFELNRLGQKHTCEDNAIKAYRAKTKMIWVWYEDQQTHEYWCGLLDPEELTTKRIEELAPHIEILNSDKNIWRIRNRESN